MIPADDIQVHLVDRHSVEIVLCVKWGLARPGAAILYRECPHVQADRIEVRKTEKTS